MAAVSHLLDGNPEENQGRWREVYHPSAAALFVELGCGMGRFCTEMAARHPETLYIAAERVPDALVVGLERCQRQALPNLRFISGDAEAIPGWFVPGELDGMYLNFCDPWPRKKQFKRRLTHPRFLALYHPLIKKGGVLTFKTDNRPLFDFSLDVLQTTPGWTVRMFTMDLHAQTPLPLDTVITEYEEKWMKAGAPIHALEAVRD